MLEVKYRENYIATIYINRTTRESPIAVSRIPKVTEKSHFEVYEEVHGLAKMEVQNQKS